MICGNEVEVPADLNFGKLMLRRLRDAKPDHVCMVNAESGKQMTYKELTQYTVSLAASLLELGVQRGDTVGVGSENRLTFLPTGLAVVFTGAAYTPFDLKIGREKHHTSVSQEGRLLDSYIARPRLRLSHAISTHPATATFPVSATLIARNPDADVASFEPALVQGQTDTALILYSSGTTGMPKGVQMTHLNCIVHSFIGNLEKVNGKSLETIFIYGAWTTSYDIYTTFRFLCVGKKIVYVDDISPVNILKSIEDHQVNILILVPSTVSLLSKADEVEEYDLRSLKIIYCAGYPLRKELMETMKKRFPNVENLLQLYGATELGDVASEIWGTKGPKPGSVGMAALGVTLKIVDPVTRQILGPNQHGEICVRGPNRMKGYIDIAPSKYLDDQGFFLTGDLGYYDEDHYLFIVDRLKDIICYDGFKIAPIELETVLQLHPGVREAAVVGRPVEDLGEEPTAFVVREPAATVSEHELQQYVCKEVRAYSNHISYT